MIFSIPWEFLATVTKRPTKATVANLALKEHIYLPNWDF
jgi:ABC-type polysaccharide/polyol phosphate export permease